MYFLAKKNREGSSSQQNMSGRTTPRRVSKAGAEGWPAGIIIDAKSQYGPKGIEAKDKIDKEIVIENAAVNQQQQNETKTATENLYSTRVVADSIVRLLFCVFLIYAIVQLVRYIASKISNGASTTFVVERPATAANNNK